MATRQRIGEHWGEGAEWTVGATERLQSLAPLRADPCAGWE